MHINNSLLSNTFNKIHHWSEPEQHPLTRMFLTRLAETACAVIEAASIIFKSMELIFTCGKQIALSASGIAFKLFPSSQWLQEHSQRPSLVEEIKDQGNEIRLLVSGLACTIFVGIFFSPEANFKLHLKLKLVVDDLAEKMQKKLASKLQAELQKAEITKARDQRIAQLEAEQQAVKKAESEAYAVNARLAELL